MTEVHEGCSDTRDSRPRRSQLRAEAPRLNLADLGLKRLKVPFLLQSDSFLLLQPLAQLLPRHHVLVVSVEHSSGSVEIIQVGRQRGPRRGAVGTGLVSRLLCPGGRAEQPQHDQTGTRSDHQGAASDCLDH